MKATDLIRALQQITPAEVVIGDGKILYWHEETPCRIYVLPIEENQTNSPSYRGKPNK